jgi:amidase
MSTWITRIDAGSGDGLRLGVKDAIDVAGVPTVVGCAALADAPPAERDAPVVASARAAGARIVGKTNLHELCFGGTGINPWTGTPVNPLDPARIPGGSSSGSAVAVATGEADLALGSDTAGSIRTPSACCGTVGLKTTWGRLRVDGVWPLAPSLDTVGPMARDVAGVVTGMALLEPGFAAAASAAPVVGRLRIAGAEPEIDAAIDALLATSELDVVDLTIDGWDEAVDAAITVLFGEAWRSNRELYGRAADLIGESVRTRLEQGREVTDQQLETALAHRGPFRDALAALFARVPVLVLPTLGTVAPRLDDPNPDTRTFNAPINLSGHPALALPVPMLGGGLPASLQLVGPDGTEDVLCATGLALEAAAYSQRP